MHIVMMRIYVYIYSHKQLFSKTWRIDAINVRFGDGMEAFSI